MSTPLDKNEVASILEEGAERSIQNPLSTKESASSDSESPTTSLTCLEQLAQDVCSDSAELAMSESSVSNSSYFYYQDKCFQLHGPVPAIAVAHAFKRGVVTRQSPCFRVRFAMADRKECNPKASSSGILAIRSVSSSSVHSCSLANDASESEDTSSSGCDCRTAVAPAPRWAYIDQIDWRLFRQTRSAMPPWDATFIIPSPVPIESQLHFVPSELTANLIGVYLRDLDAHNWAQCCKRSLEQLQQYVFKCPGAPSFRFLRLSSPTNRSWAAFGRVGHLGITDITHLHVVPNLPPYVKTVEIRINDKLFEYGNSRPISNNMITHLPSTVEKLIIEVANIWPWLNGLRISKEKSRLRGLRLLAVKSQHCRSAPTFIRESLPSTLTELILPVFVPHSVEQYPTSWPPNLTKLDIDCSADSPFAQGMLPPLPATLTNLVRVGDLTQASEPLRNEILQSLPITTWTSWDDKVNGWKLPPDLTSLSMTRLEQIVPLSQSLPFTLPSTLRELILPAFQNPEQLKSILPASITSMTLMLPNTERPFEHMLWPDQLRKLMLIPISGIIDCNLKHWNPPSPLTDLSLTAVLIQEVPLPPKLSSLELNQCKNSCLHGMTFPQSLTSLSVFPGYTLLRRGKWQHPPHLTSIDISGTYNDHMTQLPPNLTRLSARYSRIRSWQRALPAALLRLELQYMNFSGGRCVIPCLPPNLRCLQLPYSILHQHDWLAKMPKANQIPSCLREVWMISDRYYNRQSYPRKIPELLLWAKRELPHSCAFIY